MFEVYLCIFPRLYLIFEDEDAFSVWDDVVSIDYCLPAIFYRPFHTALETIVSTEI